MTEEIQYPNIREEMERGATTHQAATKPMEDDLFGLGKSDGKE